MDKKQHRPNEGIGLLGTEKPRKKLDKAKSATKVAAGALAIGFAYFGVIALLMAPIFDIVS